MAILPGFPGLEADVLVNGVPRKEYEAPDSSDEDSPNTVTTYIEAEDDVNFAVLLRRDHRFKYRSNELCLRLNIDGKNLRTVVLGDHTSFSYGATILNATFYDTDGGSFKRKFFFSTLTTSDAPIKTLDRKLLKEMKALGQISIKLYRVVTREDGKAHKKNKEVALATGDISEKALKGKAISRKTKLGPPLPSPPLAMVSATWTDPVDKPFAVFNFRYRSMNDLKAELIIPRSESPVPLEDRPVEELSPDEMRELLTRQKQQKAEAARVKRENRNDVKRELNGDSVIDLNDEDATMLPAKRRRVEIVDLT